MGSTPKDEDAGTKTLDSGGHAAAMLAHPVAQRFALEVIEGPAKGAVHVSLGGRASIGSHPSNDFAVDDRTVSRFHCEVWLDEAGGRVRDLESRNGTRVDGVGVFDGRLSEGSLLRLGDSGLRFSLASERTPLPVSTADSFGRLVGASILMRAAFYRLERARLSDATVLLEGETGTGKDAAAESIHSLSARSRGPFVVIDCGAVAANLIESELFGHEKGAFTGAVAVRAGAFESAHGGTIFLDELGELPSDLQPKLLRVLEQRTVQRIGSTQRIPVDVRIIAATNRDLRKSVNDGAFRPDLYFRLAVIKVRMPSLRERPEDIPALVVSILKALRATDEQSATILEPASLERLKRGAWPGNVRELRNYLEQSLVLADPAPRMETSGLAAPSRIDLDVPFHVAKRLLVEDFERRYVAALLLASQGNVTLAAKTSGIERKYLHRLRRKLEV